MGLLFSQSRLSEDEERSLASAIALNARPHLLHNVTVRQKGNPGYSSLHQILALRKSALFLLSKRGVLSTSFSYPFSS